MSNNTEKKEETTVKSNGISFTDLNGQANGTKGNGISVIVKDITDAESVHTSSDYELDLDNLAPSLDEKRMIIEYLLQNNFPFKVVGFFVIVFILIGVFAIGLEVVLIVNHAYNYKIANGIWAGVFSIINGISKLIYAKTRTYRAHVISQVITPYQGLAVSVGLTLISTQSLRKLHCDEFPDRCLPPNREIIITMLSLGLFSLVMNVAYMFVFFNRLHGSWIKSRAQKLGFFQAYGELGYVCNCCCSKSV